MSALFLLFYLFVIQNYIHICYTDFNIYGGVNMKKRVLSIIMAAIMSFGAVGTVFANSASSGVITVDEKPEGEVVENVTKLIFVDKKEVIRYNSEEALILFDESEFKLAETLNKEIRNYVKAQETEMSKNYKMNASAISHSYSVYARVYESKNMISVVLYNYNYTGGAHGMQWLKSFVGYKDSEKLLTLEDIVLSKSVYESKIKKLINEKIDADSSNYYQYAESAVNSTEIKDRFYIDNSGNIVIYYQPYEVAPYAGGIKYFVFTPQELNGIITQDLFYELRYLKAPTGDIVINNEYVDLKCDVIKIEDTDGYSPDYIPVREVFELLGCQVTWNENDGVVINNMKTAVSPTDEEKAEFTYKLDGSNIFASVEPLPIVFTDGVKLNEVCDIKNVKGTSYISFSDLKKVLTGGAVMYDQYENINIYY